MKTEIKEKEIKFGKSEYTAERNKKILKMLADDKRPKEIAKELPLNIWTVRHCINTMVNSNGYRTLAALVADAIRKNLIC